MLNIHIYPSTYEYEARMVRIAELMENNNFFDHVYYIGIHKKGLKLKQELNSKVTIDRIKVKLKSNRQKG